MKYNKKGFSIVIAMGLVLITTLLAFTILEFIIPFSRDLKGVENSTKAYYQANNGIEMGLFHFSTRADLRQEKSKNYGSTPFDYKYNTISSGSTLPNPGFGNSDFDNNWDTVNIGNPIQLSFGNGFFNNTTIQNVRLFLRVPNLDKVIGTPETLSGGVMPIVNWQLSSDSKTLNSNSGSIIKVNQVCSSNPTCSTQIQLFSLQGIQTDGIPKTFQNFYTENCLLANKCILKFSVINQLRTNSTPSVTIPYLEWKLTSGSSIPLRYSRIESEGKSFGFTKSLEIRVPQETVSEAFDFTVFQ